MHQSTAATRVFLGALIAALGCTQPVADYCDENTPCSNPERSFCDLQGAYEASDFISNTCIPTPPGADSDANSACSTSAECMARDPALTFCAEDGECLACEPGAFLGCQDTSTVLSCSPDGMSEVATTCQSTCDAGLGCTDCSPNTSSCDGDQLSVCGAGGVVVEESTCALDCHSAGDRCNELQPSNGLSSPLADAATAPDVILSAGATIDTDDGTISGTSVAIPTEVVTATPVDIFVVKVKTLAAQDITVTGTRALAIVSHGDIVISGALDVSARHQYPGPGAVVNNSTCSGGDGGTYSTSAASGGGGGGFGTPGAAGGESHVLAPGGNGGAVAGSSALTPLRGGCEGGWAGGANTTAPLGTTELGSSPGAGGGAVQLVSRTKVELASNGRIVANGGSAKADTGTTPIGCFLGENKPCGPGNGAGSGGGILIEAPIVTLAPTARLAANGGAGHCGTKGRATAPTDTATPAPGTDCGVFAGGNGAAGSTAATAGTIETSDGATGAGGGAGRIRVNLPAGHQLVTNGAVLSPPATVGTLATQ